MRIPLEITQMPKDGHWSKLGAQMIAENVSALVETNTAHRSTATFTERPALFGDQKPIGNTNFQLSLQRIMRAYDEEGSLFIETSSICPSER